MIFGIEHKSIACIQPIVPCTTIQICNKPSGCDTGTSFPWLLFHGANIEWNSQRFKLSNLIVLCVRSRLSAEIDLKNASQIANSMQKWASSREAEMRSKEVVFVALLKSNNKVDRFELGVRIRCFQLMLTTAAIDNRLSPYGSCAWDFDYEFLVFYWHFFFFNSTLCHLIYVQQNKCSVSMFVTFVAFRKNGTLRTRRFGLEFNSILQSLKSDTNCFSNGNRSNCIHISNRFKLQVRK